MCVEMGNNILLSLFAIKKKIKETFSFRINCTIPGIESLVNSKPINACSSKEKAIETSNKFTKFNFTKVILQLFCAKKARHFYIN